MKRGCITCGPREKFPCVFVSTKTNIPVTRKSSKRKVSKATQMKLLIISNRNKVSFCCMYAQPGTNHFAVLLLPRVCMLKKYWYNLH